WYVVPADDKRNARLIVSQVVLDTLAGLSLELPKTTPQRRRELLALRSIPGELDSDFIQAEEAVQASVAKVGASLGKLDSSLVEAAGRAGSKMLYQLRRLRARAGKAQLRRNDEVSRHADWLSSALFPNKSLQEREIAGVSFLARHGRELLPRLYEAAKSDCPDHQLIYL
ncbi:MAG: bacillithiol biosynthesis BshC, partial [Terriglobales bacterium]